MSMQIPLDFGSSSTPRTRKAKKRFDEQPALFNSAIPNLDIHLHSPTEAVAHIAGKDPERVHLFLSRLAGGDIRPIKNSRVAFPAATLDRFLHIRPPAQVTLDANCIAVGRALWARELGLRPLKVQRSGQRLLAKSVRWPAGFGVRDVSWAAIATLIQMGVDVDVDADARRLLARRLSDAGAQIAEASLAGTAVLVQTSRPDILEGLQLPALAYADEPGTGRYKIPLLAAAPVLNEPTIKVSQDLRQAILRVSQEPPQFNTGDGFPWTLYPFQRTDAAYGKRILQTTGGVLLAGEMGSGKTTISLALAADLDMWPLLVISPLSAFSTWDRQLNQMGKNAYLAVEAPAKSWEAIETGGHDAVIISYDRLHAFGELVERIGFAGCIADEIQRIRTPGTRRSRALRSLAATMPYRIGLSGTPMTNTIHDLLPLGSFLIPGEWNPRANAKDLSDTYPGDPVEAIADHLGTMMVRRKMMDTGANLPERRDHRAPVSLTPEQRRALADLAEEIEYAKKSGEFDGPQAKFNALVHLGKVRAIVNSPTAAGVPGPHPKVAAAVNLAEDFIAEGRKGVIFCADRTTFTQLGQALERAGIGWVGIWGSTSPVDRIANEKRFHSDPNIKVVVCTIQAGAESWSASPTGTWLISTAYMYSPSLLEQMEARVHRMNSDPDGPIVEIIYLHATAPGGTIDDRMVEILQTKKTLIAQVVDRVDYADPTRVHYSLGDLMYLLTGKRDDKIDAAHADQQRVDAEAERRKEHAKRTLYGRKGRNKNDPTLYLDDGSTTLTWEELVESDEIALNAADEPDAQFDAEDGDDA